MKTYDASEFFTSADATDFLGRGSYASVRRCRHKELGSVVAKCFEITGGHEAICRHSKEVFNESEVLCRIEHENVIKFHGATKWSTGHALILEEAEGSNLEDFIINEDQKHIPWLLRLQFFSQIASGIRYLHYGDPKKSYIHGDLKSQNILLTRDLVCKIADFGSVSIVNVYGGANSSLVITATTQHTPIYTAPEFLKDWKTPRTTAMDVYSYAMIGYEIITRHQPFYKPEVPMSLLQSYICDGRKPNVQYINEAEESLPDGHSTDHIVFECLKSTIEDCWKTNSSDRLSMSEVENRLIPVFEKLPPSYKNIESETRSLKRQPSVDSTERVPLSKFSFPFKITEAIVKENQISEHRKKSFKSSARAIANFSRLLSNTRKLSSQSLQGGQFLVQNDRNGWKYDISGKKITNLPEMNLNHSASSIVKYREHVFIISGWKTNAVERFDTEEEDAVWLEVDPTNKNRWFGSAACAGDKIYVSGGFWGMSSVECYDMKSDRSVWISGGVMKQMRSSHALVAIGDFPDLIYAIGGVGINSAEVFDCRTETWADIPSMNHDRNGLAAVACEGEIYAIGGESDAGLVKPIEKFNPFTQTWSEVAILVEPRYNHGACVVDRKIYIVGGNTNVVEMFDPKANVCTKVDEVDDFKDARCVINM